MGSPLPLRLAQKMVPDCLHKVFGIHRSTIFGEARWMNPKETNAFFSGQNRGLVCSPKFRLSLRDSFRNLALVAPTGSGKDDPVHHSLATECRRERGGHRSIREKSSG